MTLNKLVERYKEYVEREWEGDAVEELTKAVEKSKMLDLMYTTINDDEAEVQVSYDIKHQDLIVEISFYDKSYIYKETYILEDMYDDLEYASFDGYYSYAHQVCEERFSLDLEW